MALVAPSFNNRQSCYETTPSYYSDFMCPSFRLAGYAKWLCIEPIFIHGKHSTRRPSTASLQPIWMPSTGQNTKLSKVNLPMSGKERDFYNALEKLFINLMHEALSELKLYTVTSWLYDACKN